MKITIETDYNRKFTVEAQDELTGTELARIFRGLMFSLEYHPETVENAIPNPDG